MTVDYSEQEIRELVEEESAVDLLRQMNVENPSETMDCYITSIPKLLQWFENEGRDYPWRKTTDTWKILLAEILLQRTRADAVSEVYPKFVDNYPNPDKLYRADEENIRDQIETLGFVNQRLRTLKSVSELLVEEYDSQIPENLEELKQSWRVGDYVVRAVQIFARDKPKALVDSNISRIIGRVFNLELPSQPHKSEEFYELMEYLTPKGSSITRNYYFALIDLGALVCTPENPDHEACPFQNCCDVRDKK